MSSPRQLTSIASFFLALGLSLPASAQLQPGQQPGGTVTPPGDTGEEGPAEEAPKTPGLLPTTPVLPPPKAKKKEFQLVELDGYFRFRGDWFKKFDLGFVDDPSLGGGPFPNPLACQDADPDKPCEDTLKSANMRLRLEPTLHIDEKASVHLQVDVLDNLVLGSTPNGYFTDGTPRPGHIPTGAFGDMQAPPARGANNNWDSVRVKRAWAEIMTPFGLLEFGRMPWHWGLGIYANAGGFDPIHGSYDLDSDFGDSVDRVSFSTIIPGTSLRGGVAMDWSQTAPSSAQTDIWADRNFGQPYDLDDNDDVNQWVFTISRLDSPTAWQNLLDDGELALNYGAFLAYRTQGWEQRDVVQGEPPPTDLFVERDMKAYIPDVWLRVGAGNLELELEGVAILGSIENLADFGASEQMDLRQYGGVARVGYHLLDRDLLLQFEVGYASGDQWDNDPQGSTHVSNAVVIPPEADENINRFFFDFDYEIDLILFRELMGTVSNATYLRPRFEYAITDKITARGQSVVSFANVPVATPGNGSMYGVELDADLGYHSGGFFAGISYGVLFPLSALDHPADAADQGGPGFGYGLNVGDAETAQTIQTRLMLQF